MSGKIEMSLDDIIKQNKKNKPKKSPAKRPAAAAGGKKVGPGGAAKRSTGPVRNARKPGGGVIRNRSQGSITKGRRPAGASFGRSLPSYKREAFLGGPPRRFGSSAETTKLIVSNLDFGVTDSDILELFSEFGPLKSAGVHYDRSGRSMGSADLIFERRADAIKAMKRYNGVPLDGREMNIQLVTSEIPGSNPIRGGNNRQGNFNKAKSGPAAKRGNQQRNAGNKKSGTGGNTAQKRKAKPAGGKAKKPAPPTAEELDAQLEEYVKSKVSTSEGA